ncbi:MAG TPA: FAD-binding oxidoreductase [Ktedonobacterales bacterium]|nr:FAD-binding oxidoreductase [Ktedonobacterales bacterium]
MSNQSAVRSQRHAQSARERVAIIGGGVSGALTAVALAEHGFRVIALEKASIGNGSSQRSLACIRAQFGVAETVLGMMYSEWWYTHAHELLHTPADQRQETIITQNGYLFLYEHPDAIPPWRPDARQIAQAAWEQGQANAAMHQRLGLPVELLTPEEIHTRWPHLAADRLIGATFCPQDGFLKPDLIYRLGFRRAQELGVELWENTEVTGAQTRGGRITALETTRGPVEADWVVNATNAWAPRVSRRLGGMELPIAPIKRYLYAFQAQRPIPGVANWRTLPMTIYGMGEGRGAHSRPEAGQDPGHLLFGWSHPTAPEPDFTDAEQDVIQPGFRHDVFDERYGEAVNYGYALLRQVCDFVPGLDDCGGITATTSGYYGATPDGSPLIGHDARLGNLIHAAGFSGHGVMHAPITALLASAIIAGEIQDGAVRLPAPFDGQTINLAAFDPQRDMSQTQHEAYVL